jgi:hypothetical protein
MMKQEVRVTAVNETSFVRLEDVKVETIDKEHPCGEDEPVAKILGLSILNNRNEGSLVINLENEKGKRLFRIGIQNGRMIIWRDAQRPEGKPSETQELCETEDMGLQWLSKSDQKKIRSNPVRPAIGEFRLEV